MLSCSTNAFESISIHGKQQTHTFKVEVADSSEERGLGLMHREHLPLDQGMLFIYQKSKIVSMWMKNTLIPLDMIFIDKSGRIQHIHQNAEPGSLDSIRSPVKVWAVLEINAGLVQKYNIQIGDRILHPFFETGN